jgi:hypothetical protein
MASSQKRKREVNEDVQRSPRRAKIDEGTIRDIVKMVSKNNVRKTRHFNVTPHDIIDIAKMAQLNEKQRLRSSYKTRRHYNIEKADIEELVKTIQAKRNEKNLKLIRLK